VLKNRQSLRREILAHTYLGLVSDIFLPFLAIRLLHQLKAASSNRETQNGRYQLISRNGHPFNSFTELRKELTAPGDGRTVLDGEIVCLDRRGRPQFNDLLFHRGEPCFFAFDLLMDDGRDLRSERLDRQETRTAASAIKGSHVQNAVRRTRRAVRHSVIPARLKNGFGGNSRKAWLQSIHHRAAANDVVQELRTGITRRWRDGRNCSNVNVTKNLSLAGIHAT
jgi:hypothetical protein